MYKWGFFLMLALNAVLFGVNFKSDRLYEVNSVAEQGKSEKMQSTAPGVSHSKPVRTMPDQKPLSIEDKPDRVIAIKNILYESKLLNLRYRFEYLFTYNDFNSDEIKVIEETMLERSLIDYGCLGDGLEKEAELRQVLIENFISEKSVDKVLDMINKEAVFQSVSQAFNHDTSDISNLSELIDTLHNSQWMNVVDPFREDPFSDLISEEESEMEEEYTVDDVFDETEDLVADAEMQIELEKTAHDYILEHLSELTPAKQNFYFDQLNIFARHTELTDEIRLSILNELFN